MNNKYKTIRGALGAIFSVQAGLSDDEAKAAYREALQNLVWGSNLREELTLAVSDPNLSWCDLLSNQDYEVFEAESETQAQEWVRQLLWEGAFGGQTT